MATAGVVTFAFFFELVGAIFLILIGVVIYRRYLEFRQKATLFLTNAVVLAGAGILISSIGRAVALSEGIVPAYHGFQYTPYKTS